MLDPHCYFPSYTDNLLYSTYIDLKIIIRTEVAVLGPSFYLFPGWALKSYIYIVFGQTA